MSKMKGWKTTSFAVLTMLGAAVQAGTGALTPDQMAIAMAAIGAITFLLRAVTNTPLGQGGAKQ